MRERKKRLTAKDLKALGATPGLMAHRVGPDGRARLEELALEGDDEVSTNRPRALVEARHEDVARERATSLTRKRPRGAHRRGRTPWPAKPSAAKSGARTSYGLPTFTLALTKRTAQGRRGL